MKFKNFDIEDVFGPNDIEDVKAYIGKKGYYTDSVEFFDHFIENKKHIDTLYSIEKDNDLQRFIVGSSFDCCGHYTFFLPLDKVKKTEQVEKEVMWRPCKTINEFTSLLQSANQHKHILGRVAVALKNKATGTEVYTVVTSINVTKDAVVSITLGDSKTYYFDELWEEFEIEINNQWQPFGVEIEE